MSFEVKPRNGSNGYHSVPDPPTGERGRAVISVRDLSKSFQIGQSHERATTAAEAIIQRLRNPFPRTSAESFWALRGIDLDIYQGEVVGIIGRNGAGKSTFLKVLSRITEPTTGRIELHGRVGSLLEVGTGFHPELTGRENIYLNGSILGMTRREIDRRFDEIVAFSETDKFLDTPVKRYSSGMAVRLAFAVAAHLDTEILIVDEVLAVGDVQFQKKCLGKMRDVATNGRTILFVSHSMATVLQLCTRAVILKQGQVYADGKVADVVQAYLEAGGDRTAEYVWDGDKAPEEGGVRLRALRICDRAGQIASSFYVSDSFLMEVEFDVLQGGSQINPAIMVMNAAGGQVFGTSNFHHLRDGEKIYAPGAYKARCLVPGNLMNDGAYKVSILLLRDGFTVIKKEEIVSFQLSDDNTLRGNFTGQWTGEIRPDFDWEIKPLSGVPVAREIAPRPLTEAIL